MGRGRIAGLVLLGGILIASVAVVFQVFVEQYASGNAYRAYSTYRTDPQGLSALFAALDALPGVASARNIDPIAGLDGGAGRSLVIAAAPDGPDSKAVADRLEDFVADGGVIFAAFWMGTSVFDSDGPAGDSDGGLPPEDMDPMPTAEEEEGVPDFDPIESEEPELGGSRAERELKEEEAEKEAEEEAERQRALVRMGMVDLEDRWGYTLHKRRLPRPERGERPSVRVERVAEIPELPEALQWYGAGYFANLDEDWRTIYAWNGRPVLIEREFPGGGTILLATDQYYLSNEALSLERESALLTWLLARRGEVLFDETHLGTATPNFIMGMIRRFRLHGVLAVFALLALLYIWKNSSSLAPRTVASVEDEALRTRMGRESAEALHHLLRRTVPVARLLGVAFSEWRSSAPRDPGTQRAADEMAKLIHGPPLRGVGDILARYRELCAIASRRGRG